MFSEGRDLFLRYLERTGGAPGLNCARTLSHHHHLCFSLGSNWIPWFLLQLRARPPAPGSHQRAYDGRRRCACISRYQTCGSLRAGFPCAHLGVCPGWTGPDDWPGLGPQHTPVGHWVGGNTAIHSPGRGSKSHQEKRWELLEEADPPDLLPHHLSGPARALRLPQVKSQDMEAQNWRQHIPATRSFAFPGRSHMKITKWCAKC